MNQNTRKPRPRLRGFYGVEAGQGEDTRALRWTPSDGRTGALEAMFAGRLGTGGNGCGRGRERALSAGIGSMTKTLMLAEGVNVVNL